MSSDRFTDPNLLILTSLACEPRHGYAIMDDVEEMSGVRLGPGTLYGALARLEERGLIVPVPSIEDAAPSRRRPYRLTERGSSVLREELQRLEHLTTLGLGRLALGGAT